MKCGYTSLKAEQRKYFQAGLQRLGERLQRLKKRLFYSANVTFDCAGFECYTKKITYPLPMKLSGNKNIIDNIRNNLLALAFGFAISAFCLLALETSLRYYYADPAKSYYSLSPALLNHVALFKRSNLPKRTDASPRIFCLGGSTTNGNNMPIPQSYPNILQFIFYNQKKSGSAYNFGISGISAVSTNFFIKNILPGYGPSCVVIHDGYNDLPIVIKKSGEDKYQYIAPDYGNPYNPYIKNPVFRYITSFMKFNLRSTRRFIVTFVKDTLHKGGDLFLGFDYKKFRIKEGGSKDILIENEKRFRIMLQKELDSIEYCLKNGIKVIVILEPYIKPFHYVAPYGTGFRDENVGPILSDCHKLQQARYAMVLLSRYHSQKDVLILDMREIFKDRYPELFYDECHLNGKGNAIKAALVYQAALKLFPE